MTIQELLLWRLARAEAEAPAAPGAIQLLEKTRPWWEVLPEQFLLLSNRVRGIEPRWGYAMSEWDRGRSVQLVPTVIHGVAEPLETSARVLYLSIRDQQLRLRLQLDARPPPTEERFEATFVSAEGGRPLFSAIASRSAPGEYRLDTELGDEVAACWQTLKVTDRMPFRLILRPISEP